MKAATPAIGLAAIAIAALLLSAGCVQPEGEKYTFELDENGVVYASNTAEPRALLREFAVKHKVILATEVHSQDHEENPQIYNWSAIPFYVVIAGSDRNAIQLILFIEGGEPGDCITNLGDVKTQVDLEKAECLALLEEWSRDLVISLPLPDKELARPLIVLEESKATIKARNTSEQSALSRALMRKLYPNADSILEAAGSLLKEVG